MLRGNVSPLMQHLRKQLQDQVEALAFEQAGITHQKIERLTQFKSKSTVANGKAGTVDVFSLIEDGTVSYVNYLSVNEGSITRTKTIELERSMEENKEEVMAFAVHLLRNMFSSEALELVVPFEFPYPEKQVSMRVPKAGEKKKLLDLSEKNVLIYKRAADAKKSSSIKADKQSDKDAILHELKDALKLTEVPLHIECFDNSNLHGTDAVAAMVCFKNGNPSKADYRHFNIRTVQGIDDFASMREVVYRRYDRLLKSALPLPDLVIIDGGKGQLNAALESIRALGIENRMTLIGLAKQQEELFFSGDQESIQLDWNSEGLKLIRFIRDEVHRFGITHHRNKRSRSALQSGITEIKGIGETTMQKLIKRFRSIKGMKEAGLEALIQVVGEHKAKLVWQHIEKVI
jgi:excinuclease ABC subunit C